MWGCLAKVVIPNHKKVKIGPKIVDYVLIGYVNNSSAYMIGYVFTIVGGVVSWKYVLLGP